MQFVIPLGQAHGDVSWRAGPKAANLSLLKNAGFPVPAGFVITTNAMDEYLRANGLLKQTDGLLDSLDGVPFDGITGQPQALRDLVLSGEVPETMAASIREAFRGLGGVAVSVRSSSTMEDRPDVSFAGQHDTMLNVRTEEALWDSLKRCWASLWSDRAVQYMRALSISPKQIKMGVLVQELVPAEVAGVTLTINPLTGDANQTSVSAAFGLGEAAVSGHVSPDHVLVQREPLQVLEYTVGDKSAIVAINENGGTSLVDLPQDERTAACVSREQALQIADLAHRVEREMGGTPQDVEWALHDGELFVLQARPVVRTVSPDDGVTWESPVPGAHWRRTWRLGEWLSEPVTPLFSTWSLPMLVGAREETGTGELGWETRPSFSMPKPWSCLVNGYFYTRQDRPRRPAPTQSPTQPTSPGERVASRGRGNRAHLERWRSEYLPPYLERFQGHLHFDIPNVSSQELVSFVDTLTRESGEFWYLMAPIGYGFEQGGFNPYYESVVPEKDRPHYVTLFVGYPSKTLEGQEALYTMAQRVLPDVGLYRRFQESSPAAIAGALDELPDWFRQALHTHQQEFGHQVYSLDFYFPTSGELPEGSIAAIQSYLKYDAPSPWQTMETSGQRREQAVRQILDALAGRAEEQAHLRDAIEGFQACAAAREDAAFYFQHPWALIRRSVLELGRRLVAAGALEEVEHVFFLDKKELAGVLAAMDLGEAPPTLADVAIGRKSTWEHQRKLAAPDRIPVDFVVDGLDEPPQLVRDEQGTRIIGKPASPGRGKGRARIVHSPDELSRFVRGDILVTNAASPGFTPLLLVAAGLVTEAGGGATHSSLVARELGVPAVVDAGMATQVIRDGQMVEVDGTRGVVTLLE